MGSSGRVDCNSVGDSQCDEDNDIVIRYIQPKLLFSSKETQNDCAYTKKCK